MPDLNAAGRDFEEILAQVESRSGIDFRDYRRETLQRRLESRLRITGCTDVERYRSYLAAHPAELERLIEALVIPVTELFRDPWIFSELADKVLPTLSPAHGVLRAWVVGCATGEEAYTVAILLAEAAARRNGNGFEVIASDLDARSLEVARKGVYPEAALEAVPQPLRDRYFRAAPGGHRVVDPIRGRIRFASHDLMGLLLAPCEAIVAAFDLILCRNVLIYFDASLRARALERFAAVLEPAGAFVLGASESLPWRGRRFAPYPGTSHGAGIYQRGPC